MGFINILKLSLHNLKNNKVRTFLTVLVLFVVSFVIVFLSGTAYSFYVSVNENVNYVFNKENTEIRISSTVEKDNYQSSYLNISDIEKLITKFEDDKNYITYISFTSDRNSYSNIRLHTAKDDYSNALSLYPFYAKSNPFTGKKDYLESGRMWNAADEKTNNMWLSSDFMGKFQLNQTVTLYTTKYNRNTNTTEYESHIFNVAGFLNTTSSSAYCEYHNFNDTYIASIDNYNEQSKFLISNLYAYMIPQSGFQYGVEAQNYFKNLISELEDVKLSQGYISVYCELTDNLNMLVIIFYVILSVVAFISVIIILLSIGSVANTIKISAEQNRKFFGVMKAIGMKNRSLRSILTGQIVIMTLAGVIFATVAVNCIIGIIKSLLNSLLSSLFYGIDAIVVCEISIFIPIFIAALLIGFVLLFTKTSLRNFSKMDVISVINEVN